MNECRVVLDTVVDGERELAGEETVISSEMEGMNPRADNQGFDIGVQTIEEVAADSFGLLLVKPVSVDQVPTR